MFKKELYRYNSNYQNCKYYSYRLISLPFEQRFTSISARPLFKAVPSRISRWRPCFHYTAQCPVLDHAGFHFSLSPSHPFRPSFSRPGGCSTFCKSSDISTGVCSTFNLAPVNERTLISLSRVSRVRDSGVAFVGECCARNARNKPSRFPPSGASWFFWLFHSVQMFETDTQKIWFELRLDVVTTYRTNHLAPS